MNCEVCGEMAARLEQITGDTDVRLCPRHKRALRRELRSYKELMANSNVLANKLRRARRPSITGLDDTDLTSLYTEYLEQLNAIDAIVEEWLADEQAE